MSAAKLPSLIVTGSSGFLGRRLLDILKEDHRIFGIARRSQARSGAPVHPNITWFQVDIGDREMLADAFREIRAAGGASSVIHLAAHYDFTGEEHPEYWRTNVDGLRNVLEECRGLGIESFLFSSSLAACEFPPPGGALTELSPPDGRHIYSRTKAAGEAMLREYASAFRPVIVRFAALFSDWCEYPPLYVFLSTWLSNGWNRRILGGRGRSAIPYLHVRDALQFLRRLLDNVAAVEPCEVLIASPDGSVDHGEIFAAATKEHFGAPLKPIHVPKILCGPGIRIRDLAGRLTGERPFERAWMAEMIDRRMTVESIRTRERLGWSPRQRLALLRRIPFLVENMKTDPLEWNRKNRAAMKEVRFLENLKIHWLLQKREEAISAAFTERLLTREGAHRFSSYHRLTAEEHQWNHRLILRHLMNAVRTREKGIFLSYCRDLAEQRFRQGFIAHEVAAALYALNDVCLAELKKEPGTAGMEKAIHDHVSVPLWLGVDQVEETFDLLEEAEARVRRRARRENGAAPPRR